MALIVNQQKQKCSKRILHLLLVMTMTASAAVSAEDAAPSLSPSPEQSSQLATAAQNLAGDDGASLKTSAVQAATDSTTAVAENWLNQFGTARINLDVDDNGRWQDSSFDYLLPFYDNKKVMVFSQLGIRAPEGRLTTNMGIGVRTFYFDDWMLGGNIFFDRDYDGNNNRLGIGAEAWTDNIKLSANGYFGTTDWHTSRDLRGYDEKPADGFDIRAEGFLPSHPQFGASLMYEKYYGEGVALFDKDDLQDDPQALTVGVSYTPVPLITAGVDYKRGQHELDEFHFSLAMRYVLGESWRSQLSPENVALRRSLAGSRYDLVQRNNEIILQYKKKATQDEQASGDLTLTTRKDHSTADGSSTNLVKVHVVKADGKPGRNVTVNWTASGSGKLDHSSSVTNRFGDASVRISDTTAEVVTLTASAGEVTRTTSVTFDAAVIHLELKKDNNKANGLSANEAVATLTDSKGKPLSHVAVSWQVNNGAKLGKADSKTNIRGKATARFTSMTPGPMTLTVNANGQSQSITSTFSGRRG